jgi:RimJ/RimL family protein N-acetyltransferase
MTGTTRIIRDDYVYQTYDRTVDATLSFRPATMERDLGRLHTWLGSDHVKPFWQLDLPLPQFRERFAGKLKDDHLTPYIGYVDHVPMSYWEVYWAAEDDLAHYYDAEPGDQGAHVLIGPEEYLGRGYSIPLARELAVMQFSHPETERAVLEPDVRNEIMIYVLETLGFERQTEFYFEEEDKEAALMLCTRERFEEETLLDGTDLPEARITP